MKYLSMLLNITIILTICILTVSIIKTFKKHDFNKCYKNIRNEVIILLFSLGIKMYIADIHLKIIRILIISYLAILVFMKLVKKNVIYNSTIK